ncbi:FAD binding domain-containing protein [Micromonospora sp. NPDC023966]|uniref:FAD binding domain-containing protein n=1 Tax=Micromonospora sp. NPDC023966 TaxID=3154699 RepID=UPI0033DCF3D5
MKAAPFDHHAPTSLAEVHDLLARHGPDATLIAGGQSLVPLMALRLARPRVLVDLNEVAGLAGIRDEPDAVTAGALTRQRAVERSPVVAARLPLLAAAVGRIGHPQVRNRGTVGGSLALGHPAAELPAVALALDATLVLAGIGGAEREIAAGDFYPATGGTGLRPGEVLTRVRFPVPPAGAGYGFHELGRRSRDFALAGAAVVLGRGVDGECAYARVAVLGGGPVPRRVPGVERALRGGPLDADAIAEAADGVAGEVEPVGDVQADAGYRREVLVTLVRRALSDAARRADPTH